MELPNILGEMPRIDIFFHQVEYPVPGMGYLHPFDLLTNGVPWKAPNKSSCCHATSCSPYNDGKALLLKTTFAYLS